MKSFKLPLFLFSVFHIVLHSFCGLIGTGKVIFNQMISRLNTQRQKRRCIELLRRFLKSISPFIIKILIDI